MKLHCKHAAARMAPALFCLALVMTLSGCGEEDRAKRALNRIVHEEVTQFNKYHQREVKRKVCESGGQFYRVYHEREDPVVNMRRTNSIDTPYMATISFTEHVYLTKKHPSREDCGRDSRFILSNSIKREMVCTYAGGSWRKKEMY